MNKHLHTIMQKEVTRKEFLAMLGFGIVSLLGFSSVLKLLTGKQSSFHTQPKGYGGSAYGS